MARRRANLPDEEDLRELQAQFRQRQRVPRDPSRWSNLLANLMALRGYGQLESTAAVEEAWTAAVGTEMAAQTRLGKVQRGVLQVFVKSSVLIQELTFRKQRLVAELIRRLPDHKIRDLRLRVDAPG